MLKLSNGTSMEFQRPSRTTTGNLIHLISSLMVDPQTLDAQPLTLDGGKCSGIKVHQL